MAKNEVEPIVSQALVRKEDLVALLKTNHQMYTLLKTLRDFNLGEGFGPEIDKVLKEVNERFV